MDVFGVHQQLIDDYRSFTTGVVDGRDPRIKQHVAEELARGEQWSEPWLSLNPMFASGAPRGVRTDLPALARPKRLRRPHHHAAPASARSDRSRSGGNSYVLTTGSHALDLNSPPEALMAEVGRLADRIDHVASGSAVSGRNPRRRRGSQPRPATP